MLRSMQQSAICVDANLVIRLYVDVWEPARTLWERWRLEQRDLVAPTLLPYEVTNTLYRYQRQGLVLPDEVSRVLDAALALPITLHGDADLHRAALAVARRFSLPAAYDAHYLALAERLGAEFWTADRRLARAVTPTLSWVHVAE